MDNRSRCRHCQEEIRPYGKQYEHVNSRLIGCRNREHTVAEPEPISGAASPIKFIDKTDEWEARQDEKRASMGELPKKLFCDKCGGATDYRTVNAGRGVCRCPVAARPSEPSATPFSIQHFVQYIAEEYSWPLERACNFEALVRQYLAREPVAGTASAQAEEKQIREMCELVQRLQACQKKWLSPGGVNAMKPLFALAEAILTAPSVAGTPAVAPGIVRRERYDC